MWIDMLLMQFVEVYLWEIFFSESMHLLDEVSKNKRIWYTKDAEVGELAFTYEMSVEQRKKK